MGGASITLAVIRAIDFKDTHLDAASSSRREAVLRPWTAPSWQLGVDVDVDCGHCKLFPNAQSPYRAPPRFGGESAWHKTRSAGGACKRYSLKIGSSRRRFYPSSFTACGAGRAGTRRSENSSSPCSGRLRTTYASTVIAAVRALVTYTAKPIDGWRPTIAAGRTRSSMCATFLVSRLPRCERSLSPHESWRPPSSRYLVMSYASPETSRAIGRMSR